MVIAGPNGAGKTTLAPTLLQGYLDTSHFVNADTIARGLDAFSPESVALEAGRIMLARIHKLADRTEDFGFETTLASRTFAHWLRRLKKRGYEIVIFFLALPDPEMANERVAHRVRLGGHHVEPAIVQRRFLRGLRNFFELYRPIADRWWLIENTTSNETRVVAYRQLMDDHETVDDMARWEEIRRQLDDV